MARTCGRHSRVNLCHVTDFERTVTGANGSRLCRSHVTQYSLQQRHRLAILKYSAIPRVTRLLVSQLSRKTGLLLLNLGLN